MGERTALRDQLVTEASRTLASLDDALRQGNPEAVRHHLQNYEITLGDLEDLEWSGVDDEEPDVVKRAWAFLAGR